MKYPILFSFLILIGILPSDAQIFLSDSIPVSPDNTYGYRAPRIALMNNDQPVVYWGKPNGDIMYLAFWQNGAFTDPVEVNTGGINTNLWGGGLGPQIATFGNTIFLVFEEYGEGIFVVRSTDGGLNFDPPVSVYDFPSDRVGTLPTISVTPEGNPIVAFVTTNHLEQDALYEITVSNDGGLSFEEPTVANLSVLSGEVCECCPASIAINSDEEVLLSFRNNENNIRDIWVAKSTDGAQSFPEATDIDDTDWFLMSCPNNGPHSLVANDSLITTYYSAGNGFPRVYLSTLHVPSMQKGVQFELPTTSGQPQNQNHSRLAGNLDTLGVVWQESQQIGTDVILAYSVNGTADLKTQIIPVGTGTLSQSYPDIVYSNGVFHIVYQDQLSQQVWYRQASFEPISSGTEIFQEEIKVSISPNPTSNFVRMKLEKGNWFSRIQVVNVEGMMVKDIEISTNDRLQDYQLDLGSYSSGIYTLVLQTKKGMAFRKISVF